MGLFIYIMGTKIETALTCTKIYVCTRNGFDVIFNAAFFLCMLVMEWILGVLKANVFIISCRSILLVEKTGVPRENIRITPWNWQTFWANNIIYTHLYENFFHYAVSSTPLRDRVLKLRIQVQLKCWAIR